MNYLTLAVAFWKASRSKIRKEWWGAKLTDERLGNLLNMMLQGLSHEETAAFCREDYGVKVDPGRLSELFSAVQPFFIPALNQSASRETESIVAVTAKDQEKLDATNLFLLRRAAYAVLRNPVPDSKQLAIFASAVLTLEKEKAAKEDRSLKERDIDIKLRRLEILERQTNQAKEKLTAIAAKGGLSPEALKQIESAAKILS